MNREKRVIHNGRIFIVRNTIPDITDMEKTLWLKNTTDDLKKVLRRMG